VTHAHRSGFKRTPRVYPIAAAQRGHKYTNKNRLSKAVANAMDRSIDLRNAQWMPFQG